MKACTHRWQWGRSCPASNQKDACQRCMCSNPHRGSPLCGWWWPRCPLGTRRAPRAAVHSRCPFGRAGSSAGSGSGRPASAPASGIHPRPLKHCRSEWRASPQALPDALVPLPCLIHPPWGQLHTVHKKILQFGVLWGFNLMCSLSPHPVVLPPAPGANTPAELSYGKLGSSSSSLHI